VKELTDSQLLRRYAEVRSEEAFALLVARHVDFVYSAARRMVCDPHLAQDVTQSVFVALAGNAAKLMDRPVLSGWLHRTAQNIAAQTVRGIERRRAREQEAVAMNEPSAAESDAAWKDIAPFLDTALGELNEADRDALLLRYFERKSAREMAQTLGVSDEAAQKRVNRAVERLRAGFAKRGLAIGTSGLVAVISANAVEAAPAGLAVVISSTAPLAATALGATTTAIKTIAMTTLQKTVITATVAITLGAGIYEARQASQLREQVQTLQQQDAPLAGQLDRLRREHDEATNRLALANAEINQLRSNQNQAELLKLRSQVGTLRRQVVSLEAKANPSSFDFNNLLANPDPATRDMLNQQARREIKLRFADFFAQLRLTPDQIETFAQNYANSGLGPTDAQSEPSLEKRLRSLLGDSGYDQFKQFEKEVPARATVSQLNSQLGANQLTGEQSSRLLQIVKAEPYDLTYGIEGDLPDGVRGSPDEVGQYLQKVADSNQHIAQQAAAFLAPDQLTALNTILSNALNTRAAEAAAFQKR
jgi:RNA polymerase sigma factor (sigma-70 family)